MTKVLYNTKYLQLKSTPSPSGNEWVYAHRPNATDVVIIVPLIIDNNEEKVLFIREQRPPMYAELRGKYNIGLAAGLVGDESSGVIMTLYGWVLLLEARHVSPMW